MIDQFGTTHPRFLNTWGLLHKKEGISGMDTSYKNISHQLYPQYMGDATYRKTSNISRTFVGNNIVDNSDVVGASPVGAAPTTSSFST